MKSNYEHNPLQYFLKAALICRFLPIQIPSVPPLCPEEKQGHCKEVTVQQTPAIQNKPSLVQYCKHDIQVQASLLTYPCSHWSAYFLIRLLAEKKLPRGLSHICELT